MEPESFTVDRERWDDPPKRVPPPYWANYGWEVVGANDPPPSLRWAYEGWAKVLSGD